MPRPKKHRHCECRTRGLTYKPTGIPLYELEQILIYRDELEALKLCDYEGFKQVEAGEKMGVSRGTVQRLLAAARQKTAQAFVTGKALVFEEESA